jgi:hypothetical protein
MAEADENSVRSGFSLAAHYRRHRSPIRGVAFNARRKQLASLDERGVKLWQMPFSGGGGHLDDPEEVNHVHFPAARTCFLTACIYVPQVGRGSGRVGHQQSWCFVSASASTQQFVHHSLLSPQSTHAHARTRTRAHTHTQRERDRERVHNVLTDVRLQRYHKKSELLLLLLLLLLLF